MIGEAAGYHALLNCDVLLQTQSSPGCVSPSAFRSVCM
jgi:hypothetical protein